MRPARLIAFAAVVVAAFAAAPALAHQPRLIGDQTSVVIDAPEISKAYYGDLAGSPAEFTLSSGKPFNLYVGILVPIADGAAATPSVDIFRDGQLTASLVGLPGEWKTFHEEFAGDNYLEAPEYRAQADPGEYILRVSSVGNYGKYVLVVGEAESFPPAEIISALKIIPRLKSSFFVVPRWTFLFSIFGSASLAITLIFGFLCGWILRSLLKLFKKTRSAAAANMGRSDRYSRLALAVAALLFGLCQWSLLVFALVGFLIYEAIAGWCVLIAIFGRKKRRH